jgi:methionyl aminopeptidase
MDQKTLDCYLKAGEINKKAQSVAKKNAIVGKSLLELAEEIEEAIIKAHGKPAFPVNLSANNFAAHFTPSSNSEEKIGESDVLKIDIGVHVNGFVADAAFTADFSGKNALLVEASANALEAAAKKMVVGTKLCEIGKAVEQKIRERGYAPIQNLSGHGLEEYETHSAPTIPNIENRDERTLEDGMAVACEPFASTGEGFVMEGTQTEIYSLKQEKPVRNQNARKILEHITREHKTLPFAVRQIQKALNMNEFALKTGLHELMQKKVIHAYPVLKEKEGVLVSQAETSFVFFEGKTHRLV